MPTVDPCEAAKHMVDPANLDENGIDGIHKSMVSVSPPFDGAKPAFQSRARHWVVECFGKEIAADIMERVHRFLEESLELAQSKGCTADGAHQLVEWVFNRPVGDPFQEAGGVRVTFSLLCSAAGIDEELAGEIELARISQPGMMAKIRAKHATKPKHSPLPGYSAPAQYLPKADINTYDTVKRHLDSLNEEERCRLINEYCLDCGSAKLACSCMSDDQVT